MDSLGGLHTAEPWLQLRLRIVPDDGVDGELSGDDTTRVHISFPQACPGGPCAISW
jgi:hypothetical protein